MKTILLLTAIFCYSLIGQAQKSPIKFSTGIELSIKKLNNSVILPQLPMDLDFQHLLVKMETTPAKDLTVIKDDAPVGFHKMEYVSEPKSFKYTPEKKNQLNFQGVPETLYFLAK